MIEIKQKTLTLISAILLIGLLCSCTDEFYANSIYGQPVSHFKFEVLLSETVPEKELFDRFRKLSLSAGLTRTFGNNLSTRPFPTTWRDERSMTWGHPVQWDKQYRAKYTWYNNKDLEVARFTVLIHQRNTDDMTLRDWIYFEKWKSEILPQEFPGAQISVVEHPATFTPEKFHTEYAQKSGAGLPNE